MDLDTYPPPLSTLTLLVERADLTSSSELELLGNNSIESSCFPERFLAAVYLANSPSLPFLAAPFALVRKRPSLVSSSSLSMLSLLLWGAFSLALVSLSRSTGNWSRG